MKIHIISDLHLEVSDLNLPVTDADLTIFAGDISPGTDGLEYASQHAIKSGKSVIYVCGNHEFYRYDINKVRASMAELATPPKDNVGPVIHYLENNQVVIDRTRILGCTLWTDFLLFGLDNHDECMRLGQRCLNDFHLIQNGEFVFSVAESIKLHQASLAWLTKELNTPFAGKTVVVTHHLPSFHSVVPRYAGDYLSACFASRLDHLFGKADLWVHGHTHDSLDYTINGTRVICNPRGYCRFEGHPENGQFNPALVVEI
jgi:predicted phosphodiesterase